GDKVGPGADDTASTPPVTAPTGEPGLYDGFTDLSWLLHSTVHSFARVTWNQDAPMAVHVEFSVDEGEWLSTPTIDGVAGANEQLVVGIPYGMSAAWRVVGPDGFVESDDPIEVARIPDGLPQPRLEVAEPGAWIADGNYLLTSISETGGGWSTNGPFWTVVLDRRGRAVWASRTRPGTWTLYAQVSVTGDHILFDEYSWFDGPQSTFAQRTYLDEPIEASPEVLGPPAQEGLDRLPLHARQRGLGHRADALHVCDQ
ncbi:MAG: hypothetical protein GY884_21510, partial [Proteobacteria bacterium]|nr:hypothetical protein [Pseudomonadota bacterium]